MMNLSTCRLANCAGGPSRRLPDFSSPPGTQANSLTRQSSNFVLYILDFFVTGILYVCDLKVETYEFHLQKHTICRKQNNGLMEVDWLYYVCLSKESEEINSTRLDENRLTWH